MRDLEEVRSALIAELGSEERLPMVNARVILRTGVNLTQLDRSKAVAPERVQQVVVALREMGFKLDQVAGGPG